MQQKFFIYAFKLLVILPECIYNYKAKEYWGVAKR